MLATSSQLDERQGETQRWDKVRISTLELGRFSQIGLTCKGEL